MNGLLGDLEQFPDEMRQMSVMNQPRQQPQRQQPSGDLGFMEKLAIVLAPTAYSNIQNARAMKEQQAIAASQTGSSYGELANYWAARDPVKARQYAELAQQQRAQEQEAQSTQQIAQEAGQINVEQGGNAGYGQMAEQFTRAGMNLLRAGNPSAAEKMFARAKELQGMRDKLDQANLGNRVAMIDPFTGQPVSQMGVSVSPDSQLSAQVQMRGQNMTDARARAAQALQFDQSGLPVRKPLNPTETKLFSETEEALSNAGNVTSTLARALEINDLAYSGPGALARAKTRSAASVLGDSDAANKTIELDNLIGTQALQSLRSIFGGNPTEGERKILLDLQASVNKTPEQRKVILQRAKDAAEKRIASSSKKLEAIATGTYGTAQYLQQGQSVRRFNPETGRIE